MDNDFALVGSFSLEDSFGETVLAQNPQVPDVSTTLDPALIMLPNTFSANPTGLGWPTGPLQYFKKKYPTQALHTAVLSSAFPSALASWNLEKPVLKQAGYHLVLLLRGPDHPDGLHPERGGHAARTASSWCTSTSSPKTMRAGCCRR